MTGTVRGQGPQDCGAYGTKYRAGTEGRRCRVGTECGVDRRRGRAVRCSGEGAASELVQVGRWEEGRMVGRAWGRRVEQEVKEPHVLCKRAGASGVPRDQGPAQVRVWCREPLVLAQLVSQLSLPASSVPHGTQTGPWGQEKPVLCSQVLKSHQVSGTLPCQA